MKKIFQAGLVLVFFAATIAIVQSCTKSFAEDGSANGSPVSSNAQTSFPEFDKQYQEVVLIRPVGYQLYFSFVPETEEMTIDGYGGAFKFRNVKDAKVYWLKAIQLNEGNKNSWGQSVLSFETVQVPSEQHVVYTE